MKSRGSEGMGKEGGQEQSSAECVAWQKGCLPYACCWKGSCPQKPRIPCFCVFVFGRQFDSVLITILEHEEKKKRRDVGIEVCTCACGKVRIDPFCFFPSQGLCSLPCCCLQCFSFNTNYSHGVSFSYYALHRWLFIFSANLSTGQQMSLLFRCNSFFFLFFTYKRLTFKWSFHQATAQTYMKGLAKGYTIYRLSTGFYTVHIRGLMSSKVNDL